MKKTDPEVAYLWLARRIADVFSEKHGDIAREDLIRHALVSLIVMNRALEQVRGLSGTCPMPDSARIEYNTRLV